MKRSIILGLAVAALFSEAALAVDIGGKGPTFRLKDVRRGGMVGLEDFSAKKAVVVIFIATGCPYSNAFNGVMNEVAEKYQGMDVAFVGINSNSSEPAEKTAEHAKEHRFGFPVLKDEGSRIADLYAAQVTPEVFLLDAAGYVRYHGAIGNSRQPTTNAAEATSDELSAALDEVLSGKNVSQPTTKMFGCTIKR